MPKACDIMTLKKLRLLIYGPTGAGKTSLFRTLPGKKFLFVFDPAGLCSIQPEDDIEFELFVPDSVNLAISTIRGDSRSSVSYSGSDIYTQYERFISEKIEEDYFSSFDWVGFDSITTFQDLMLDQVANLYGREGKIAQLEDYGIMADALRKNLRQLTSLPCNIIATAHEKANQDKLLRTISMGLMVPGQMQQKLPLLFSEIYKCKGEDGKFFIQTSPSEDYPLARCSLGLEQFVEVTIPKGAKDPSLYGLGKIIREKGFFKDENEE